MTDVIISSRLKRQHFHVVVLVPSLDTAGSYPEYRLHPCVLHEESFGKETAWEHDYAEIARCKALQLWHGRNDGRAGIRPHLLFSGDTPYYGGVHRHGIVVACSGVQQYFDQMIAGMVSDMCIALAHDEWERSEDKKNGVNFLS